MHKEKQDLLYYYRHVIIMHYWRRDRVQLFQSTRYTNTININLCILIVKNNIILQIVSIKIENNLFISLECKTNGGNVRDEPCVFPFIYEGDVYQKCTAKSHDQHWCFTKINEDGIGVGGQWGNCGLGCESIYTFKQLITLVNIITP